jgi:uncharacterized membrane protein YcfT
MSATGTASSDRVAWVDYAKGACIVMVVMMHSTLGVGAAVGEEGWLHYAVAFAKPFRMPDFFLISGLFLARVIDRDPRTYFDRKVVHFAYFYVLWLTIQFAFKAPAIAAAHGAAALPGQYLLAFVEPFGTLWFIYLLPIFFAVTRLVRNLPLLPVWLVAAALEIAPIETQWTLVDEFARRFVYFYTGYVMAPFVFLLVDLARRHVAVALAGIAAWATVNGALVFGGYAELPLVSLGLGFLGVAALMAACGLMEKRDLLPPLRYCGRHSLVIYLAFFLPMAATRMALIKSGLVADVGTISALVTLAGIVVPLAIYWLVRGTPLRVLFERPDAFWIAPRQRRPALQPAE